MPSVDVRLTSTAVPFLDPNLYFLHERREVVFIHYHASNIVCAKRPSRSITLKCSDQEQLSLSPYTCLSG